jgi:hypothetical protein
MSTTLEIHTLIMAPRKFYHPQALKRCALEPHAATLTLRHPPSPSSAILPPSGAQAVRPRNPRHPDCYPQVLQLYALELQTFPLLPSISSAILPPSSSHAVHSRAPCCYLHPPVTLLGDFTTLKFSSCAPSKFKPSGLLPSSSQAVCSRAPDLPIATFDLLGNFTTQAFKLCALEPHALRIATLQLQGRP